MADSGPQFRNITRREFLNYVWVASMALFMAEMGGAIYAFSLPRFREGEFGGTKIIGAVGERLPNPDSPPVAYPEVKVWLVHVGPDGAAKGGGHIGLLANADKLTIVVQTGERINLGKRHFYTKAT